MGGSFAPIARIRNLAPNANGREDPAQGFNPGKGHLTRRRALKPEGAQDRISPRAQPSSNNFMHPSISNLPPFSRRFRIIAQVPRVETLAESCCPFGTGFRL